MGERFTERRAACPSMETTTAEPSALQSKRTSQPSNERSSGMPNASTEGAIPVELESKIISTGGSSSTDQLSTSITESSSSATPPTGSSASSEGQMLAFGMTDGMSAGSGGFAAGVVDARGGGSSRRALGGGVSARPSQDAFQEQQTGGEVAAGEESIEAATAKLRLSDVDNDGEQWQSGSPRGERERESQPKFGLKVLVPGLTAGCLIGKGGRIINQLQTTTGTRVKLSQKNEFFPGTHDRVALVQGEQPAMVGEAVAEMVRRLKEAGRQHPHSLPPMHLSGHYGPYGFHVGPGFMGGGMEARNAPVTVKLLVPLAAGGLIIGKGGETIKAIGARTGARVILAGKDADVAGVPSERLCSIQGDLEGAIKVVLMIVGKMAEDRGLSKYQSNQTCYQTGLVGIVSDVAPQPQNLSVSSSIPPHTHWGRPNRPISGGDVGAFQGGLANGISSPSVSGGCGSPQQPQLQQQTSQQQVSQPQQTPQQHQQHQLALAASGHVPGMMPGGMLYGFPFHFAAAMQAHRPFGDAYSPGNLATLSSMYPYANEIPYMAPAGAHQGCLPEVLIDGGEMITQVQVSVPDHMVGVILGKGGSTVIDMQNITGARIQVSQRGDYIPGTHNRAVTISGTQQAVGSAQMMLHNVCVQAAQYDYRQGMHQQQIQQLHHHQQTPHQQQQAPFF